MFISKIELELKEEVQFFAGAYVVIVPEIERQRRRSLVDFNDAQIWLFDIINTNRSVVNILVPLVRISWMFGRILPVKLHHWCLISYACFQSNSNLDLSHERWSDLVEQTTMLMMILGRWLLPTAQGMSKDSLSQLLLVNLAMCADIIEFFDLLKLAFVHQSQKLIITILVLWTWSLMQFPFNTMSKFDDDQEKKSPTNTNTLKIGRGTIFPFENDPIPSKSRVSMTSLDFRQALASKRISRDILLMSHNYSRGLPRDYLPDFRRDYYQPHLVEASNTVLENSCSSEVNQFNNNIETQTITGSDQTRGPGRFSLDVGQMRPNRPTGRMTLSKTSPNLMLDDSGHTRLDQTTPSSLLGSDPNMKAATGEGNHAKKSRIDSELVTILMSLFMQDGPFLTFRLFIIARYQAYNYMIIFLTAKNALVLMLQVYRLCVLHCSCYDHMENDFSPDNIIDANARLKNVQVAIAHYEKETQRRSHRMNLT